MRGKPRIGQGSYKVPPLPKDWDKPEIPSRPLALLWQFGLSDVI